MPPTCWVIPSCTMTKATHCISNILLPGPHEILHSPLSVMVLCGHRQPAARWRKNTTPPVLQTSAILFTLKSGSDIIKYFIAMALRVFTSSRFQRTPHRASSQKLCTVLKRCSSGWWECTIKEQSRAVKGNTELSRWLIPAAQDIQLLSKAPFLLRFSKATKA